MTFIDVVSIKAALNDLPLACVYDVIDYAGITNADLKYHIDQMGRVFYSKPGSNATG